MELGQPGGVVALQLAAQKIGKEMVVAILPLPVERGDEQVALVELLQERLAVGLPGDLLA